MGRSLYQGGPRLYPRRSGGAPTVLGTLIGGFAYSSILATLFLALGGGAILYVVFELARVLARAAEQASPAGLGGMANFIGLLLGLLLMYGTGLLIAV